MRSISPDSPLLFAVALTVALTLGDSLVVARSTQQGPVDKDLYFTKWVNASAAHAQAKQFRVGILYYFPPKAVTELHELFGTEPMSQLSRRAVVVLVDQKCRLGPELRKRYEISEKAMTFAMTDYHGNLISKFVARRGLKEKIDVEKTFGRVLKNAQAWIDAQRKKIRKDFAKGKRYFDKEDWRRAIASLSPLTTLMGFRESEEARKLLEEIVLVGERELERTKKLDPDVAIKSLKKIAKEFAGTSVEKKANDERAKLEAKP